MNYTYFVITIIILAFPLVGKSKTQSESISLKILFKNEKKFNKI
jgi:hypothetical protein